MSAPDASLDAAKERIQEAVCQLENMTTDAFSKGGDREVRELLVESLVLLRGDAALWSSDEYRREYPNAVRRGLVTLAKIT